MVLFIGGGKRIFRFFRTVACRFIEFIELYHGNDFNLTYGIRIPDIYKMYSS